MSERRLNKREAIKLITPVVDGEAAAEKSNAFYQYIKHDDEVYRWFQAEKEVKNLIQYRLPRYQAPRQLRRRIESLITHYEYSTKNDCLVNEVFPSDSKGMRNNTHPAHSTTFNKIDSKELFFSCVGLILALGLLFFLL